MWDKGIEAEKFGKLDQFWLNVEGGISGCSGSASQSRASLADWMERLSLLKGRAQLIYYQTKAVGKKAIQAAKDAFGAGGGLFLWEHSLKLISKQSLILLSWQNVIIFLTL